MYQRAVCICVVCNVCMYVSVWYTCMYLRYVIGGESAGDRNGGGGDGGMNMAMVVAA